MLNSQISHNYSSSSPCPHPWYISYVVLSLLSEWSILLLHLFSPLLSLEQALPVPAIVKPPTSLAIFEVLAIVASVSLLGFALEPIASTPSIPLVFLPLSYSPSNFYPTLLFYYITVLLNLVGVPTP